MLILERIISSVLYQSPIIDIPWLNPLASVPEDDRAKELKELDLEKNCRPIQRDSLVCGVRHIEIQTCYSDKTAHKERSTFHNKD